MDVDNDLVWKGQPGFYEVYYLTFHDRDSRAAFWLRYTLRAPAQGKGEPVAELWGFAFDPSHPFRNLALKQTFPASVLRAEHSPFCLTLDRAVLTSTSAVGRLAQDAHSLEWNLRIEPERETYRPFPFDFMYTSGFPKTKYLSPNLDVLFGGSVWVDGRELRIRDAPGCQSHLWGVKHAERWAWSNCSFFEQDSTVAMDVLTSQVRLGPVLSPPLNIMHFRWRSQSYTFNSPLHMLSAHSEYGVGAHDARWEFAVDNGLIRFTGTVSSPLPEMLGAQYSDPDGERRYCHHAERANCRLEIAQVQMGAWTTVASLTSANMASFEIVEKQADKRVGVWV